MKITISHALNTDPDFYRLMGRHLGHSPASVELDTEVYDRPGKQWWLALRYRWWWPRPQVVGFCGLALDSISAPSTAKFENFWVHPEHRRRGIGRQLFDARLNFCYEYPHCRLTIIGYAADASLPLYRKAGFEVLHDGWSNGLRWHEVRLTIPRASMD